MPRTARPVLLDLDLSGSDGQHAASRISAAVVARICDGTLTDGDPLPSSRTLAAQTGLPRSAVVAAYAELISAGYLAAIGGSGTTVAAGASAAARAGAGTHVTAAHDVEPSDIVRGSSGLRYDLRPGLADTTVVDEGEWRRAWRRAATTPVGTDLPWFVDQSRARRAVASHMRSARGVRVQADAVRLMPGTSSAFRAIVSAFAPQRIVAENPLYGTAGRVLRGAGVPVLPVEVDTDGLRVDLLPDERVLVYVTPAHQFPLGHRLSVERRAALVAWARRTGSLVIEDDYDGEFRYDVPPMPALQSLEHGPDVVAYVGTASKILTPSLQMAWVVAPPRVRPGLDRAIVEERLGLPPMIGEAVAELVDSGSLARAVGRATRLYRARRTALLDALQQQMPWCRVVGVEAGLHLVLMLPPFADDVALVESLAGVGVAAKALSPYYLADPQPGLVLGYTRLCEHDAAGAAAAIAGVISPA